MRQVIEQTIPVLCNIIYLPRLCKARLTRATCSFMIPALARVTIIYDYPFGRTDEKRVSIPRVAEILLYFKKMYSTHEYV